MEKKKYEELVNRHKPVESRAQNGFIAFVTGGIVGVIGQLLTECYSFWFDISSKDASTFMLVTLIFVASLFTALGFFDNWVSVCKCGLIIPTSGFAHSVASSALEYKKDGLITGLGSNFFKLAGSVILYGIISAFILVIVRLILVG